MRTANLTGRLLSYWALKAERPNMSEELVLHAVRSKVYDPHANLAQASLIAEAHKIGTAFADISQTWFAGRTDPADPKSRVWVEGATLPEAITRAFVGIKLGREVEERLGLDLDERTIVIEKPQPEPVPEPIGELKRGTWPFPHFGKVSPE